MVHGAQRARILTISGAIIAVLGALAVGADWLFWPQARTRLYAAGLVSTILGMQLVICGYLDRLAWPAARVYAEGIEEGRRLAEREFRRRTGAVRIVPIDRERAAN